MFSTIRNLWSYAPYLLPASLFALSGVLLMGLLYYPAPATRAAAPSQSAIAAHQNHWRSHADRMFATLLADAVRQLQAERQPIAPRQRGDQSGEVPASLRIEPLIIENGDKSSRPLLIRL